MRSCKTHMNFDQCIGGAPAMAVTVERRSEMDAGIERAVFPGSSSEVASSNDLPITRPSRKLPGDVTGTPEFPQRTIRLLPHGGEAGMRGVNSCIHNSDHHTLSSARGSALLRPYPLRQVQVIRRVNRGLEYPVTLLHAVHLRMLRQSQRLHETEPPLVYSELGYNFQQDYVPNS